MLKWASGLIDGPSPSQKEAARPSERWGLGLPLLMLQGQDAFTLADACEGVQVFGAPGSGKTSGSGAALAQAYLAAGMGGLICCATPEDRAMWERWAAATGRSGDLVIVDQHAKWRMNFLSYELQREGRGGGATENLVHLFGMVVELVRGKVALGGDNSYWETAKDELMRNAIEVISLSGRDITIGAICELVLSAPTADLIAELQRGTEEATAGAFAAWAEDSLFFQLMAECEKRGDLTARQANDLAAAVRYWERNFYHLAEKTRTSIVSTFTAVADLLLHGLAWELLCTDTTITPEFSIHHGAIVILDLPLEEFHETGRVIQGVFKLMYQRAILGRDARRHRRPVFIFADESQHFISSYDPKFQSACRKHRGCTVYLTQNISNYYMALGKDAHDAADALLGNFQTKVFHANSDANTNRYAAEVIGRDWRDMTSTGGGGEPGEYRTTVNIHKQLEYKIEPAAFTTLAKGGVANGGRVEAIIFQGGRIWNLTKDTWRPVVFRQG